MEESMKNTVWVVQDNGRNNLLPAARFGELKTLLPARLQIQLDATEAIDAIEDKLCKMLPDDCILAAGDPAAIGIAVTVAATYNNGLVNILKFDRQTNDYYKVQLDMSRFYEYGDE